MAILDQINCRACGEVFHYRPAYDHRLGELGNHDIMMTCPSCGEQNIDVIDIRKRDDEYQ